jgi:hypothetical protein
MRRRNEPTTETSLWTAQRTGHAVSCDTPIKEFGRLDFPFTVPLVVGDRIGDPASECDASGIDLGAQGEFPRRAISALIAPSHLTSSSSLGAQRRRVRFVVTILNMCASRWTISSSAEPEECDSGDICGEGEFGFRG